MDGLPILNLSKRRFQYTIRKSINNSKATATRRMKIYGIAMRKTSSPDLVLREVTFHGSADEIRAVARFLAEKADKMEHSTFGHAHLRDHCPIWQADDPDIVVVSDLTYPTIK